MMKHIVVLVHRSPLNTLYNAEALRMSVGLTLRDDEVTVIFIGDGCWNATDLHPEMIDSPGITKELEMLTMLNHSIYADEASLQERGITRLNKHIMPVPRETTLSLIEKADIVIPF